MSGRGDEESVVGFGVGIRRSSIIQPFDASNMTQAQSVQEEFAAWHYRNPYSQPTMPISR